MRSASRTSRSAFLVVTRVVPKVGQRGQVVADVGVIGTNPPVQLERLAVERLRLREVGPGALGDGPLVKARKSARLPMVWRDLWVVGAIDLLEHGQRLAKERLGLLHGRSPPSKWIARLSRANATWGWTAP